MVPGPAKHPVGKEFAGKGEEMGNRARFNRFDLLLEATVAFTS